MRSRALLVLVVLAVAACGGNKPVTQAPPVATAAPTNTPVESAATGYAPDTLLSIIEGPLRVRSKPSVAVCFVATKSCQTGAGLPDLSNFQLATIDTSMSMPA